jgi:hypothetical protein
MSQIVPDDGNIDARLQQSDSTTVAHNVGSNAECAEVRRRFRSSAHILGKQVGDAIASQGNSVGISEKGFVAGA